ncbi:hypothetical protein [Nocardia brasiliensis]|uniref:hypothetical protein n=1 Tax=Nocardia brasiliensis TaxID=37326 RepID=UPI0004A6C019|nr:hypothetical protein [Nocardia brasiliensis]
MLLDEDDDGTGGRPETPRAELRRILLDSRPDGTVRWGHKVVRVRALRAGRHERIFARGGTLTDVFGGCRRCLVADPALLLPATTEYAGT